ncbi:hypothetical protein QBC43DRAFT_125351 [Cladorrhinum sp. PSN259]|nr:hypothetical protein QBC43DRAFT_125351 [Cladorrhinum sp. PSN259]
MVLSQWPVATPKNKSRCVEVSSQLALTGPSIFLKPDSAIDIDCVDVGEFGAEPLYLDTEEALRNHLSRQTPTTIARYYLLEPDYGRAEIPVTQAGAYNLLSTFQVFPEIYRHMSAFGRKAFSQDEGFAGFDETFTANKDGVIERSEICYLLKYVGRRENARLGTDPWSVRHALVYQQTDLNSHQSNHILIRIPEVAKSRLEERLLDRDPQQACEFVNNWTGLHTLCFDSVQDSLRQCTNYFDQEITSVFKRLLLSGIEVGKHNEFDTPDSSARDMKTLQHLEDQGNRVMSVIELNMETLDCLTSHAERLRKRGPESHRGKLDEFLDEIQKIKKDHRFSLLNISTVMKRAKTVSEQLRDTVSVRNSEMANNHTEAIYKLTEASGQEARVVKTLTVLALFFVPASLVADFLQMGYVKLREDGRPGWVADPGLQIYASLVLPFIAFIVMVYCVVEWKNGKRPKSWPKRRAGAV